MNARIREYDTRRQSTWAKTKVPQGINWNQHNSVPLTSYSWNSPAYSRTANDGPLFSFSTTEIVLENYNEDSLKLKTIRHRLGSSVSLTHLRSDAEWPELLVSTYPPRTQLWNLWMHFERNAERGTAEQPQMSFLRKYMIRDLSLTSEQTWYFLEGLTTSSNIQRETPISFFHRL